MSGNYPPGVNAGTPSAPWNQDPPEECRECGGVYAHDGHKTVGDDEQFECRECGAYWEHEGSEFCPECGSSDVGGLPCPNEGMDGADYEDAQRGAAADAAYERQRDKEMFDR